MRRKILEFTREYRDIEDKQRDKLRAVKQTKQIPPRIDALYIAQQELGALFNRDAMTLYGRSIRLNDLMREVNRLRIAAGRDQILYSPLWEIKP